MKMTAIRPIYREGKLLEPGKPFETSAEDGKSLEKSGDARAAKAQAKSVAKPAAESK